MNVRDSEVISGLLDKAGYEITDNESKADVIIFNTCSVRQHAEDKVWSEVGRITKRGTKHEGRGTEKPKDETRRTKDNKNRVTKPIIGIVGCMANNYREAIFHRAPAVDFVVGTADIEKIPEILKKFTRAQEHKSTSKSLFERKIWETDGDYREDTIYHTGFHLDSEHAFVVIQEGCENYCSYCVVPYVRGKVRCRPAEDIIKEIKEDIKAGIKKITLLGQNVNAYQSPVSGLRSPVNFIELLKMINGIEGLGEFSFVTSHPKDTSEELFKAIAELGKLRKYLHLPVQSGSNRILKLMNRNYTRDIYIDLSRKYRTIVKDGQLTTDIIVGFPGETKEDFEDTYNLVKEIRFDAAFIFKYSPRPNTQALKFEDNVTKEEKEKRHALILELQKKISKEIKLKKNAK